MTIRAMLLVLGTLLLGLLAGTVRAQAPDSSVSGRPSQPPAVSLGEVQPTPEMWFYIQERQRYESPQAAVRRKAEFRAQQRQQRIASMKAFGLSKQRPLVYNTPFHTLYPVWNQYGFLTVQPMITIEYPPPVMLER